MPCFCANTSLDTSVLGAKAELSVACLVNVIFDGSSFLLRFIGLLILTLPVVLLGVNVISSPKIILPAPTVAWICVLDIAISLLSALTVSLN